MGEATGIMYSSFQVRMEHNNKLWEKHRKSFIALVRFKLLIFLLWFKYFWTAKLDSSQPIQYAVTMLWNWNCCKSKILANQWTVHLHACLYLHVTCPCLETYEYLYWCRFAWEVWMADSISFLGYPSSLNYPWAIMILFWNLETHPKHKKLSQILHFLVFKVNQLILLSYLGFPPSCHRI